jgi:hypothetical protein
MTAIKAFYDGRAFVPESPVAVEINQEAIITILDDTALDMPDSEWLLSFVGSIPHEDCVEIEKVLEETERIDCNEW